MPESKLPKEIHADVCRIAQVFVVAQAQTNPTTFTDYEALRQALKAEVSKQVVDSMTNNELGTYVYRARRVKGIKSPTLIKQEASGPRPKRVELIGRNSSKSTLPPLPSQNR
jgi:hypothetical protein